MHERRAHLIAALLAVAVSAALVVLGSGSPDRGLAVGGLGGLALAIAAVVALRPHVLVGVGVIGFALLFLVSSTLERVPVAVVSLLVATVVMLPGAGAKWLAARRGSLRSITATFTPFVTGPLLAGVFLVAAGQGIETGATICCAQDCADDAAQWWVLGEGATVAVFEARPGFITSIALPPPGATPARHPFASGRIRDPRSADELGRILRPSSSFEDFVRGLREAGYVVHRVCP